MSEKKWLDARWHCYINHFPMLKNIIVPYAKTST